MAGGLTCFSPFECALCEENETDGNRALLFPVPKGRLNIIKVSLGEPIRGSTKAQVELIVESPSATAPVPRARRVGDTREGRSVELVQD